MIGDDSYVPPYHPALMEDLDTESAQIHILLGELRSLTKWPLPVLCTHLGCSPREARPEGIPADQLTAHSIAYLTWVTELCNLVDRPEDRHDILLGAFDMAAGAGGDVRDRVGRCRRACETEVDGVTAQELLELGEVQKAWRVAIAALEASAERPARLPASLDAPAPHLHPRRLQWLYAGGATPSELLGPSVARRMHAHVGRCERCRTAADQLGLQAVAA